MHAFGPAALLPSTHERVHQPSSRRAAAACFAGSRLVALEVARLVVRSDSGTAVQDWAAQCTIAPHEQTNETKNEVLRASNPGPDTKKRQPALRGDASTRDDQKYTV